MVCLSPKANANLFLDYLRITYHYKIFYTLISIQHYVHQWSTKDLDRYETDDARYAVSMLHSLGYVFDDKYLHNEAVNRSMIKLAKLNERYFYQLSLKAFHELTKYHWFDLTKIFNENIHKKVNDEKNFGLSVVHLTPTRFLIMPKEKTKGHRAMRHSSFHGMNDFCLVYLKPDPPNIYLHDNYQMIEYFKEIFLSGIELVGNRYHLFGASNSQLKDQSFWFIKALSLDEVHRKRQLLGQFDQIFNLGTYVARLGLWFSKTDPTYVSIYRKTDIYGLNF